MITVLLVYLPEAGNAFTLSMKAKSQKKQYQGCNYSHGKDLSIRRVIRGKITTLSALSKKSVHQVR